MEKAVLDRAAGNEALPGPAQRSGVAPTPAPRVIYIMGTARSGTTILEVLLKNNRGVTGGGEIAHIVRDGLMQDRACSCGEPASACEFWRRTLAQAGWHRSNAPQCQALLKAVESHARFPQLAAGLVPRATLEAYRRLNERLYAEAAAVSGCEAVVDSSKYAGRALALSAALPHMKVICITRSPRGLLGAYRKPNREEQRPQRMGFVIAYYLYTLACMRWVRSRLGPRCLTVRFEDLRRAPLEELHRIQDWLGLDLSECMERIGSGKAMDVGHMITANRLRKSGQVAFRSGDEDAAPPDFAGRIVDAMLGMYRRVLGF